MKKFLHKLGIHFWRYRTGVSGIKSRTCTVCSKQDFYDDLTCQGEWFECYLDNNKKDSE